MSDIILDEDGDVIAKAIEDLNGLQFDLFRGGLKSTALLHFSVMPKSLNDKDRVKLLFTCYTLDRRIIDWANSPLLLQTKLLTKGKKVTKENLITLDARGQSIVTTLKGEYIIRTFQQGLYQSILVEQVRESQQQNYNLYQQNEKNPSLSYTLVLNKNEEIKIIVTNCNKGLFGSSLHMGLVDTDGKILASLEKKLDTKSRMTDCQLCSKNGNPLHGRLVVGILVNDVQTSIKNKTDVPDLRKIPNPKKRKD